MSTGTVLLLGFKVESFLFCVAYSTFTHTQDLSANFASPDKTVYSSVDARFSRSQ